MLGYPDDWYRGHLQQALDYSATCGSGEGSTQHGFWSDLRSLQSLYRTGGSAVDAPLTFRNAIRKFAQWGYYVRADPSGANWSPKKGLRLRLQGMGTAAAPYLPTGGPASRNGINMFYASIAWIWRIRCPEFHLVYELGFRKNKAAVEAADYTDYGG